MVGMSFPDFKKVHKFYNRYARHAGFGIRIGQHSGYNWYLYCSCQGKYTTSVSEAERHVKKQPGDVAAWQDYV
jgi:hypothetical protein